MTDESTTLADDLRQNAEDAAGPTEFEELTALISDRYGLSEDEAERVAKLQMGVRRMKKRGWRVSGQKQKIEALGVEPDDLSETVKKARAGIDVDRSETADVDQETIDNAPTEEDLSESEFAWVERIRRQAEEADLSPSDLCLAPKKDAEWLQDLRNEAKKVNVDIDDLGLVRKEDYHEVTEYRESLAADVAESTGADEGELSDLSVSALERLAEGSNSTDDPEPNPRSGDVYASDGPQNEVREMLEGKNSKLAKAVLDTMEADDD